MREFIILVGAGEKINRHSLPETMIHPWLRSNDKVHVLDYNNSIGPVNRTPSPVDIQNGLMEARVSGVENLIQYIRHTDNVPNIVSYSLGAYVHTDFLEAQAKGLFADVETDRHLLIANPRAAARGRVEGIAGAHERFRNPQLVYELSNIRDGICSTPVGSPLHKLEPLVSLLTMAAPRSKEDIIKASKLFMEVINENNKPITPEDFSLLVGYFRSAHDEDYFTDSVLRQFPARAFGGAR